MLKRIYKKLSNFPFLTLFSPIPCFLTHNIFLTWKLEEEIETGRKSIEINFVSYNKILSFAMMHYFNLDYCKDLNWSSAKSTNLRHKVLSKILFISLLVGIVTPKTYCDLKLLFFGILLLIFNVLKQEISMHWGKHALSDRYI